MTIATTNYPQILEKRFTCRPSRFNLVIEYKKPNAEVRKAYITNKLSDGGIDVKDEKVQKDIERYVEKTEGYTFDFLKEVIQGIYVDGFTEVEIFDRLEELIKKDGRVKITEEDSKKIGFASGKTPNDAEGVTEENEEAESPVIQKSISNNKVKVVKGFA